MKNLLLATLLFTTLLGSSACGMVSSDHAGPIISDISTSNKVLVISDCQSTSITITAKVTDASRIANVLLWYRVGADQQFTSTDMVMLEGLYQTSVKGVDLPPDNYGALEFYITAKDEYGNLSKSPTDNSVQFLPCVGS